MAFNVSPNEGLHFSFGPWPNCVLILTDNAFGNTSAFVGIGAVGFNEYDAIPGGSIWMGSLPVAQPGVNVLGPFLVSLLPAANAALKDHLNTHPLFSIDASSPVTTDNANKALAEFFQVTPSADGTYPVVSLKP